MFNSPFNTAGTLSIDTNADVIFVSDMFVEDYVGGAELTAEALITSANDIVVQKIKSKDISMNLLKAGSDKHWVFCNFSTMRPNLIPSIIGNLSYSIVECDYKFCAYRSIEKHRNETGKDCDCHESIHGKMISAFFHGAKSLWWMSESQEKRYLERFPFLEKNDSVVLSSVFDESFFLYVNSVKDSLNKDDKKGWIVLGSESWIKGFEDAEDYCKKNNLDYEVVWGLPYDELLQKLSTSEGFVYMPRGGDTCPRMVIEAKALGCKLILNDDVQHAKEEWFTGTHIDMMSYLYASRERFWRAIKSISNHVSTVSGYTTVRNANRMNYPWQATVTSMLGFCHEVVVVDGGSDDDTWEELKAMSAAQDDGRLKVYQHPVLNDHPSFAYESDGKLKATARSYCTSDFCWQMDADEVVHENDYEKVHQLLRAFPVHCDVVSLPVIEYWGGDEKIRMDVNPWKWRLSRNLDFITQGIPNELQRFDDEGNIFAALGTDTCDYIHTETKERIPHIGFYNEQAHNIRAAGLSGNNNAVLAYQDWFQRAIDQLPSVHHYSWYDISRKIKQYKLHWASFWKSQYRHDTEDTSENNVMFDKPWSEVTDEDIDALSSRLSSELGGWVFHEKVDFSCSVPHITINTNHPKAFRDINEK
jgi:glycosyltransferase involved in cell wall biosynthesis|tara:strand:+ start:1748 stop:3679 length:1932 start_codon:yes stop_codon:yes gene_type:complete